MLFDLHLSLCKYAKLMCVCHVVCGNTIQNGGAVANSDDCSTPCTGNPSETCGAGFRLQLYSNGEAPPPPPPPPELPPDVGQWHFLGCYSDSPAARTLGGAYLTDTTGMTVESCIASCDSRSFIYAGLEFAHECFCGNAIQNGGAPTNNADCSMPCAGNPAETCGAGSRLQLYSNGNTPPPPPVVVPGVGQWHSLGCYSDNVNARSLAVGMNVAGGVDVESCTDACANANYKYAGLEFAHECYCGNQLDNGAAQTPIGDCNMPCSGNSAELCGGPNRLNLYNFVIPPTPQWVPLGCYSDTVAARTLGVGVPVTGQVDVESCTDACFTRGFPLAGVEFSVECYCDTAIRNSAQPTPSGDCNMPCAGDNSEICGGPNRINIFNFTGTLPPPGGGPGPGPGGNPVFPVTSGLPLPWTYAACYVDNAHGRIFGLGLPDDNALTVESCIATCQGQGFTLAGLEFSVQCFCGNHLINGATLGTEASCNMGCSGNTTEACGGPNRLSVYTSTGNVVALPVPTVLTTGLPGQWQYQGCLKEPGAARVFPYVNVWPTNNTVAACLNKCAEFGYPAGGMEFGSDCWCGDVADETTNGGVMAPDSDCQMPCSGDPIHLCGGAERLQLYHWIGDLFVWHTPANIGRYEFFVPGVVVPLIATVGINDKVTFLEKGGTGFPNSTGAYELDLSLIPNGYQAAWREMHIKTDVFCAGSVILPDKAGRQLNVGGWSLISTFGVRLFTPDGSPGTPSHNDWEENVNELSLQRGRWYPTAMTLANGSILVVGGETGSNASPQPNLEILPTPTGGNTVVELDWLARTDPNNLYPFLFVLPSGHVFVGYYNEARIINEVTFETLSVLPNMPASVNNFLGGRTYPLEGAAMTLPQKAPYTDPLVVLICGGSNPGAGQAIDNCVHIAPETPNASWTIERMPSKRVMPCMVALPDGTFMIMNGAKQGVAGFGLADFPNLGALLYDPTQPLHQRFSILNTTDIARMYHSEATLLPDGRILVSGSDPQTLNADGSAKFPEEFRIEIYIPPYLNQGFTQPTFNIEVTDWAYNGQYVINVQLFQGTTANMRVSLLGASSSTHGNTMGSRTIFPAFTCSGTGCTITAPPNPNVCPPGWHMLFVMDGPTPSISKWVRIGGDPAQLGNWPDFPDFHTPGV